MKRYEEGPGAITLITQEDTTGALEQEQGDKTLPGVFAVGDVEDLGTPDHVIAIECHFLEAEIGMGGEVILEEGEEVTDATGPIEGLVEFLAAADWVGFGEFGPGAGGGKLPEDTIEQEALGPGDGTRGAPLFGGVTFLEGGGFIGSDLPGDEGFEEKPLAVVEEGDRTFGLTGVGA